jgi:asparaginyl-tRNA synthetase
MSSPRLLAALRVQSKALEEIHRYLRNLGFVEVMPIILSTTTDPLGPDPGSRIISTPQITYMGQNLVLTQSMVLHKQILVSSGLERVYTVSPNVRLEHPERHSTRRHLFEFSQVDFEVAHGTMEDVFDIVEGLLESVTREVVVECAQELEVWERSLQVPSSYARHLSCDLLERYGEDWETSSSLDATDPFWVIDLKREFYDAEEPRKPGSYRNYDLIYPEGYGEALSGGEREWQYDRIIERIQRDGLPIERFSSYLEVAKEGFVPSAGGGLGVERLTRYLVGADHVGDVQSFRRVPGERVTV